MRQFRMNCCKTESKRGVLTRTARNARCPAPGRMPHDFRRTAVRNLERAGVSRSVAMKLTGHKTESASRRHAIVVEADLTEAARKLDTLAGTFSGTVGANGGRSADEPRGK
jgi:integrase